MPPEWADLMIVALVAVWILANMTASRRIDLKPLPGQPYCAGPNWRGLVWAPAYARWRRTLLEGNVKICSDAADEVEQVLRPDHIIRPPVCPRCGLTHDPADWLEETCPYASRAAITDRLRILEPHCPHCGQVHSLAGPGATQLCDDEQHGVVRGSE
jgi:ribosomal protein S27AE